MKELQSQNAGYQKEVGKLKGNMAAAATALEAVRSNRRGLLEQATLEQVGRFGFAGLCPEVLTA